MALGRTKVAYPWTQQTTSPPLPAPPLLPASPLHYLLSILHIHSYDQAVHKSPVSGFVLKMFLFFRTLLIVKESVNTMIILFYLCGTSSVTRQCVTWMLKTVDLFDFNAFAIRFRLILNTSSRKPGFHNITLQEFFFFYVPLFMISDFSVYFLDKIYCRCWYCLATIGSLPGDSQATKQPSNQQTNHPAYKGWNQLTNYPTKRTN